ncbi:hypothetical protein R50073_41610 [Maricurvus nonylphenolicus]|uniref:phytanoyl-CoA dioxygenase family protein n=1 Tax=Maricurvus nonylphenolicus TaxID=1008307 RepID=UPI0036F2E89E
MQDNQESPDAEQGDIFGSNRVGYASGPFIEEKHRVTGLYEELKTLELEKHIADLSMYGYTIVPPEKIMPAGYITELRDAVLKVSEKRSGVTPDQETGKTHVGSQHPLGQFMRKVLFEDPVFEPLITHPIILGLVSYLTGYNTLLSLSDAMVKGPGGAMLPIHNDNGDKTTAVYPDKPQSATVNLLLSDYEEGCGSIAFLPGSHNFRREPTPAELQDAIPEMAPVYAPAGSAIIWNSNTWHMALPRENPGLRVTLLYLFCRGHLQTQSSFRDSVTDDILARNPPRFAQLMHKYGVLPFGKEDIDVEKAKAGSKRYSLFDCHPLWKDFYQLE